MRISLKLEAAREAAYAGNLLRVFGSQGCVIGRSAECDWRIGEASPSISRRHLRIFMRGAGFVLEDCSTNGVFINNSLRPLGAGNTVDLVSGDRFRVGDFIFNVLIQAADNNQANDPALALGHQDEWLASMAPRPAAPSLQELRPMGSGASLNPVGLSSALDDDIFGLGLTQTLREVGSGDVSAGSSIDEGDLSAMIAELRGPPETPFANHEKPSVLPVTSTPAPAPMKLTDLDDLLAEFGAIPRAPSPASSTVGSIDNALAGTKLNFSDHNFDVLQEPEQSAPPLKPEMHQVSYESHEVAFPTPADTPENGAAPYRSAEEFVAEFVHPPAQVRDRVDIAPQHEGSNFQQHKGEWPAVDIQAPPLFSSKPMEQLSRSSASSLKTAEPQDKNEFVSTSPLISNENPGLRKNDGGDLPFWRGLGIDPGRLNPRARQNILTVFVNAVHDSSEADNVQNVMKILFERLSPEALEHKLRLKGRFFLGAREANLWDLFLSEHREICLAEEKGFTDAAMSYAFNGIGNRNFAHAVGVRAALSTMLSNLAPAAIEAYEGRISRPPFARKKTRLWRSYVSIYQEKNQNSEIYLRETLLTGFYSAYRSQLQRSSGERE
jgi:predicted component of type VI protein secretion system